MKTIITLFVTLSLLSCSKTPVDPPKPTCWKCIYGMVQGETKPDAVICQEAKPTPPINADGVYWPQSCEKQ